MIDAIILNAYGISILGAAIVLAAGLLLRGQSKNGLKSDRARFGNHAATATAGKFYVCV